MILLKGPQIERKKNYATRISKFSRRPSENLQVFFVKLCVFAIDATSDDDKNVQNFCQKHVLYSMKKCHVLSH